MSLRGNNRMKKYFEVNVKKYVSEKDFCVYRPASLNNPKDFSVMFIMKEYVTSVEIFKNLEKCLIYWPKDVEVPRDILQKHAVVECENPHLEYCRFFRENNIVYLPPKEKINVIDGAYIAEGAKIGKNVTIMPGAYISGETVIGDDVYIGCGTKLMGEVCLENGVLIRENSVIGADGLSTDRDEYGRAVTMPQFGSVILEDGVQIGANTVIARGAIDATRIGTRSKIDNSCFISHNVNIGKDVFVVGETIVFGSAVIEDGAYVSGNATIRNGLSIGEKAIIGMGAVVVKNVPEASIVKGNPAK